MTVFSILSLLSTLALCNQHKQKLILSYTAVLYAKILI